MDFSTFSRNVKRVIGNLDEITIEVAMTEKEVIADLNVSQMERGLTEKGTAIEPEYESDAYAATKKAIGSKAPRDVPDLKLDGDFHAGVYAKSYGTYIETFSSDGKAGKLTEKYDDIWGLTSASQKIFNETIITKLIKRYKNELLTS